MRLPRTPEHDAERGASLILAIAFMVVLGAIGATLVASITTGVHDRDILDRVRDREYAADGGVESSIARVRQLPPPGPGLADCGGPDHYSALNGVAIRVDCVNAWTLTLAAFEQRNVIFTACVDETPSVPCTDANAIIRAQVNFQAAGSPLRVTRTWIQAWSVNP
jgi:hypothetical protein